MPKRKSSRKKNKESILHRDIKDLELSKSLRRLGNLRVTDWEFSDVLPAVNRLAQKEVDLADMFRRTANYRIIEWEFKNLLHHEESGEKVDEVAAKATAFLRYCTMNLTNCGEGLQMETHEIQPGVIQIRIALKQSQAAALIGHGGHTAAAIRGILKDFARAHEMEILLEIIERQ